MRTILGIVVILTCVVPATAFADLCGYLTPERSLCNSTYVVVSTVLKTMPSPCVEAAEVCALSLKIEITEILGAKTMVIAPYSGDPLRSDEYSRAIGIVVGKTIRLRPYLEGSKTLPEAEKSGKISVAYRTARAKVLEFFEGKQFIFSFRIFYYDSYEYAWPPDKLRDQPGGSEGRSLNYQILDNRDAKFLNYVITKAPDIFHTTSGNAGKS